MKYCFVSDLNMVILSNFLPPQEGIRHEEQNTTVYINDREVGKGTFYITERWEIYFILLGNSLSMIFHVFWLYIHNRVISWVNHDTQQGFSLDYYHISLHAISRDKQVHPRQCLYVMVDGKVVLPGKCHLYCVYILCIIFVLSYWYNI